MSKMIEAVIFDKDGTLFDFRQSWGGFTARMLSELAHDARHAKSLAASVGFDPATGDFRPDSPIIAGTATEVAAVLAPLLPELTQDALVVRLNALSMTAPMYPAVALREVLTELRGRGLRLALATNDTEEPARAHLAEAGIEDLFDFIAGCDSGHGAKPEPGMLLAFAQAFDLAFERVVMVGDSRHDLAAGRAAGMRVVGVLTGIADRAELEPHADVVLPNIAELADWIDSLGPA